MKKHKTLLAVILGISCLCSCSEGKIDEVPTPQYQILDYDTVKEGYYLSDSGDGSYYLIKDGKITFAGYDWERGFRKRNPRNEHSDMTDSEYEEFVSEYVEADIRENTDRPFAPIRAINPSESYPPIRLVTNPSPEGIESWIQSGRFSMEFISMKDENTIGTEPPFYVYCGTSRPESEQTDKNSD